MLLGNGPVQDKIAQHWRNTSSICCQTRVAKNRQESQGMLKTLQERRKPKPIVQHYCVVYYQLTPLLHQMIGWNDPIDELFNQVRHQLVN